MTTTTRPGAVSFATYEHRICPDAPRLVQVRPVGTFHGRPYRWDEYMSCDTPTQAERVLTLLQGATVGERVRP